MNQRHDVRRRVCGLLLVCLVLCGWTADPSAASAPATTAEAAAVLDLGTLPLASGAETPAHRNLASVSYVAPGAVKDVFEFHRKQLLEQKWTELPNSYVTEQSASAVFTRDGFRASLTVFPGSKPGAAAVMLQQHGNVDLSKLPVPPGAKPLFAGPANAMYVAEASAAETAEACRKLLVEQGWQPYGTAGDVAFYKQNAVRLLCRAAVAPAQGGKTMIDYSATLMSGDLPAPQKTEQLQYSDAPIQLFFDTPMSQAEVVAFYRDALGKAGWKATTDNLLKSGFRQMIIFRNPQKDLLTLEIHDFEGKTRVKLKFESAAEVAELERRVKEQIERKKAEQAKPRPRLAVSLPSEAKEVQQTKSRIEFKLPSGKGRATVESWRTHLVREGWKEDAAALEAMAGSVSMSKDGQSVSFMYTDTGFLPTEVTVQAVGVDLERAPQ